MLCSRIASTMLDGRKILEKLLTIFTKNTQMLLCMLLEQALVLTFWYISYYLLGCHWSPFPVKFLFLKHLYLTSEVYLFLLWRRLSILEKKEKTHLLLVLLLYVLLGTLWYVSRVKLRSQPLQIDNYRPYPSPDLIRGLCYNPTILSPCCTKAIKI